MSRPSALTSGPRSTRTWAGPLVGSFVVGVALMLTAAAVVVRIAGWDLTVVTSGSMAPKIGAGDVVAVRPIGATGVRPGDVVLFDDADGRRTLHRVASVAEDGTLRTKGDANDAADSTPVPPAAVHGRAAMVLPHLGYPALAVARRDWPMLLGVVVVGWLLVLLLPRRNGRAWPDRTVGASSPGSPYAEVRIGTVERPLCAATAPTADDLGSLRTPPDHVDLWHAAAPPPFVAATWTDTPLPELSGAGSPPSGNGAGSPAGGSWRARS